MGCNCKKTFNKMEKYSDDYNPKEEGKNKLNWFLKIIQFILQLCFGIFVGTICIIILPFFILYIIYCMIFNKTVKLNLGKKHNKK